MTDLASLLIRAIEQNREQIEHEAEPFIGRIPFHVNFDVNLKVQHAVYQGVEPCRDTDDTLTEALWQVYLDGPKTYYQVSVIRGALGDEYIKQRLAGTTETEGG